MLARNLGWTGSRESLRLERGFGFLATTGSAAPFIGLFGTVIGIINAFEKIGQAGSASLAVVAPGIAEALIATAVGLFAAIPATIFYNIFVGQLRGITAAIDLFIAEYEGDLRRMAARAATRASRGRAAARRAAAPALRDQRHALRRRGARAADHLHGDGADAAAGPRRRSPEDDDAAIRLQNEPLVLTVRKDGKIFLARREIPLAELEDEARGDPRGRSTTRRSSCAPTPRPSTAWS